MDILILVAAVLLIGLFCYKNVPTLIGGIVCSVILMIIYKMNIVDGLFDTYMGGLVGFMKSWMILFFLGALFGKLLDVTGGSDSLARVILNLVGPKNVSLGVCLFTAILAMAGISSFISLFICYPIALKLCRKANINRASVIAGYSLGLNFGLAIPWVPVTNNVLCASYFGTDVSAGGLLGLFVSIVFIVVGMLYIKWYEKRLAAAGKGYAPAYGTGALEENNDLDEDAIHDGILNSAKGDCLLVVGDEDVVKVHYHTDTPWKVLEYAAALGELNTIIVENMERQAKGLHG